MLSTAEGRGAVLKTSSGRWWEEEGRELTKVCLLTPDSLPHSGKYTPVKGLEDSSFGKDLFSGSNDLVHVQIPFSKAHYFLNPTYESRVSNCYLVASFFFLKKKCLFIYLFLAALGLCGCARAFSSWWRAGATFPCGARASHSGSFSLRSTGSRHAGFSSCGMQAQLLWLAGSRAQAQ